jgi:hypothetical protein
MKQFMITPAAGKRLIGKAVASHPAVTSALEKGTVVIVAGTTNGYVAEEILASLGQADGFSRRRFFRGITLPPRSSQRTAESGRLADESGFPGDVVIVKGRRQQGRTEIYDVVDELKEGDVIVKGANAVDLASRTAGILIGHPKAGTIGVAFQAFVGRRVRLILPVGLEKRVACDLAELSLRLSAPGAHGARLLPVRGDLVTELDAVAQLTGASAELVAAGGVGGAEGCCWLAVDGTDAQLEAAERLLASVAKEPAFEM